MRRYASTGTSYGPVSVCLSQVGVLSKRLNESDCFLVRVLPSTYLTLCYKTILIRPEIKLLPSGTLFQSRGLGKFHHGISIVKTFYQLSSRKVDAHSVINCYWTIKYYLRKGVRVSRRPPTLPVVALDGVIQNIKSGHFYQSTSNFSDARLLQLITVMVKLCL